MVLKGTNHLRMSVYYIIIAPLTRSVCQSALVCQRGRDGLSRALLHLMHNNPEFESRAGKATGWPEPGGFIVEGKL